MMMPFEWDVRVSSKDHTVTASTSCDEPATARYTTLWGTTTATARRNCSTPPVAAITSVTLAVASASVIDGREQMKAVAGTALISGTGKLATACGRGGDWSGPAVGVDERAAMPIAAPTMTAASPTDATTMAARRDRA